MINRDKYIVLKTAELQELLQGGGQVSKDFVLRSINGKRLPDAVVIRTQDVFAGPALHGYAAAIGVARNLLPANHPDRQRLGDLADYFHEMAEQADQSAYKVPDDD